MEYQNLDFWTDADVGYVALDRPNHRNALSFDLLEELVAVAREISSSDLRTVVVTGNGTDFCAGFDVSGSRLACSRNRPPSSGMRRRSLAV